MRVFVIALVVGTFTTVASAQAPVQPAPPTAQAAPSVRQPMCLSSEHCTTILLLETTWGFKPVVADRSGTSLGGALGLEGGLVVNAGHHQGFGASGGLHYVSEASAVPFVIHGRYRRWLSEKANLDVSPGLLVANVNRGGTGGTLQLSYERSGKLALVVDVDVYRSTHDTGPHTVFELGIGVKFCGWVSLPTALLTLLFAAAGRGTG